MRNNHHVIERPCPDCGLPVLWTVDVDMYGGDMHFTTIEDETPHDGCQTLDPEHPAFILEQRAVIMEAIDRMDPTPV